MKLLGFLFALSLFGGAFGAKVSYSGHQVWRIVPHNEQDLEVLRGLDRKFSQLDYWQEPTKIGRNVDIRVSPGMVSQLGAILRTHKMKYNVHIDDLEGQVNDERARSAGSIRATSLDDFDYSNYHDANEVYEWMEWIEEKYEFITKVQVATTYEGRPVYALEVFKPNPGETKPKIYYDSLIHCREWITTATALWTFNEMLTNTTWQHMIDDFDWYFIPMLNVDGYVETWTGDRLWRKTRSTGASSSCIGIDANRNFDEEHWSFPGASDDPCSIFFHGPTPASESEIRHLQNYILSKEIDGLLSVHSYSQLILYPYGWSEDLAPDNDELNATSKHQHDAIYSVHQKRYVYGPVASTIYMVSGSTVDFGYNVANIKYSFTYELRDEGKYAFELPADQIIPNGEEFIAGLNAFIQDVKASL